jgi:glycine betaine/proline transport system ATP-binding protein
MNQDRDFGYVLDADRRFLGVVSVESLRTAIEEAGNDEGQTLQKAFLENVQSVSTDTPMQEILPFITEWDCPVPVVDEKGVYQGAVSKNRFLKTLKREG